MLASSSIHPAKSLLIEIFLCAARILAFVMTSGERLSVNVERGMPATSFHTECSISVLFELDKVSSGGGGMQGPDVPGEDVRGTGRGAFADWSSGRAGADAADQMRNTQGVPEFGMRNESGDEKTLGKNRFVC